MKTTSPLLLAATLAACVFGDDRAGRQGADAGTDRPPGDGRPNDGGEGPDAPAQACSLFPQAGCPAGQACDVAEGSTACRPAGFGTATATCATDATCAPGRSCVADGDSDASCLELCQDDDDCAPDSGSRCVVDEAETAALGLRYCSEACSPASLAGCPAGWNCTTDPGDGVGYTFCLPAGDVRIDGGCTRLGDCVAGATCVSRFGLPGVCGRNCRVGVTGGCPSGEVCRGFAPPNVIGGTEWGTCA
ncbi:MAG: hypothetical protein KBG28_23945 [Kofleriaceae bacterium]|jgi:hypothetical protein|nr:hypothetical protein [Kofleriaceae bacterium]